MAIEGDLSKGIMAIGKAPLDFRSGVGYDTTRVFAAVKETVGLHCCLPPIPMRERAG